MEKHSQNKNTKTDSKSSAKKPFFSKSGGDFFNQSPIQKKEQPFFSDDTSNAFFQPINTLSNLQVVQAKSGAENNTSSNTNKTENKTGMSDELKEGVEGLSGIDMSDVKVHYNSDQPEELNAKAYAQGTDIHLGPGQEEHLPHEAWHVVQQKQGRVKPTIQMKGAQVNDDQGLEKEADEMGEQALNNSQGDGLIQLKNDVSLASGEVTQLVAGKAKLWSLRKLTRHNLNFSLNEMVNLAISLPNMVGMDIVHLSRVVNPGFNIVDIANIANTFPVGTNGRRIYRTIDTLNGLTVPQIVNLVGAMVSDGMTGVAIKRMVVQMAVAPMTPIAIYNMITQMRGNLHNLAPSPGIPSSREITDVPPAPAAGVAPVPTDMPGLKILGGAQIKAHLDYTVSKGRGANTIGTHYPNGDPVPVAAGNIDLLWTHCRLATTLNDVADGTPETLALKQIRQKMALNALMLGFPAQATAIQRMFDNNEGHTPRLALNAAQEDAYGAAAHAHISARHVFGPPPPIQDIDNLAMRVTRHVGGFCPGLAGAFNSPANAQTGMQNALTAAGNGAGGTWANWRRDLTQGNTVNDDILAASVGTVLELNTIPPLPAGTLNAGGNKVLAASMPNYAHHGGHGNSPLYLGDPNAAGIPPPHGPPLTLLNVAPTQVHLRIIPNGNSPGGFFIHSAWPLP